MSPRDWRRRVEDILDAIAEIQTFTRGMTYESFCADPRTVKAVIMDLAIIGEAANHVDDAVVDAQPEVPWALVRAMRNRVVHVYFDIDPEIIWSTVQNDLPPLVVPLRALLQS